MPDLPRGQREAGVVVGPTAGVAAGCGSSRQSGGREGLDADRFFTHDPRLSRVQLLPEASEPPRVGRKSVSEPEHGALPSGLRISGQEVLSGRQRAPDWRSRLPGLPTADHVAYPTKFWRPVQNLVPGRRVANPGGSATRVGCFGDVA